MLNSLCGFALSYINAFGTVKEEFPEVNLSMSLTSYKYPEGILFSVMFMQPSMVAALLKTRPNN